MQSKLDWLIDKTLLRFVPSCIHPNDLTWLRLLSVPFIALLLVSEQYVLGTTLFVLSALTDCMDGALARRYDKITDFGTLLDPVADKLLIGLVGLLVVYHISPLLMTLILLMETAIVVCGYLTMRNKDTVIGANWAGKCKMVLQCIGVGLALLGLCVGTTALEFYASLVLITSLGLAALSFVEGSA